MGDRLLRLAFEDGLERGGEGGEGRRRVKGDFFATQEKQSILACIEQLCQVLEIRTKKKERRKTRTQFFMKSKRYSTAG